MHLGVLRSTQQNANQYKEFRIEREKQIDAGKWDYRALMVRMSAWSTNPEYAEIILQAIVDNKLP